MTGERPMKGKIKGQQMKTLEKQKMILYRGMKSNQKGKWERHHLLNIRCT